MSSDEEDILALADFEEIPEKSTRVALQNIFSLLRSHIGHDFSLYKSNTICRRIERRMNIYQISDITNYVNYLKQKPEEINILSKELLIGVTNFFRDRKAYEILRNHILPKAVEEKANQSCFRVWVPACSTGEEAYSIAMLLQECITDLGKNISFQIFSSDIDDHAIKIARTGMYSRDIAKDVSADRLQKFFTKIGDQYRIIRELRECIVFASQSVIKDPPFTRIDLLSCRNLLIYLGSKLQKKLLPLFHYSLNPGGILFLGASESIGGFLDYFETLGKRHKIYRRKDFEPFNRGKAKFPITQGSSEVNKIDLSMRREPMNKININEHLDKILIENCIPPSIITDKNGEIIYVHGSTGNYVEPASGTASLNIIDMARTGLGTKLSYAIRKVNAGEGPVIYHNLRITEPTDCHFNLIIKSAVEQQTERDLIVIIFEELDYSHLTDEIKKTSNLIAQNDPRVPELERELKYTKEHLQSTIEELKSTNEELQSTNEELQSTNEELETSKEELVTVNAELESRIEELSNTNDDIKNLLDSTSIATIFLDDQLGIKRFTPKATEIIRLIPTDIGRTVDDIVHNLEGSDFIDNVKKVINTSTPIEMEVRNRNEQWYYMRITPYQTTSGVTDGVVLTFENITEIKRHRERLEQLVSERTAEIQTANRQLKEEIEKHKQTETALRHSEARFRRLFELDIMGIFFVDKYRKIVEMNGSFSKMIGYSAGNLPLPISNIIHPQQSDADKAPSEDRLKKGITTTHEKVYLDKNKESVYVLQAGILLEEGDLDMVFFVMDMTPSKKVEEQLRQHQAEYAHVTRINTMGEMATGIAHEINQPLTNITNYIHGLQLRIKEEGNQLSKDKLFNVMNQISAEAKRSSSILKKMRDLVQKKKFKVESVNVNAVIHNLIKESKGIYQKDSIQVDLVLEESLPPMRMDKIQLEQILINLLNNAIEAFQEQKQPQPSRHIQIETHSKPNIIEINVKDEGKTISSEAVKKIFDMFYTTKQEGLGLGLSISRTIVESYGGYLHYLPREGKGNIFRITLPITLSIGSDT